MGGAVLKSCANDLSNVLLNGRKKRDRALRARHEIRPRETDLYVGFHLPTCFSEIFPTNSPSSTCQSGHFKHKNSDLWSQSDLWKWLTFHIHPSSPRAFKLPLEDQKKGIPNWICRTKRSSSPQNDQKGVELNTDLSPSSWALRLNQIKCHYGKQSLLWDISINSHAIHKSSYELGWLPCGRSKTFSLELPLRGLLLYLHSPSTKRGTIGSLERQRRRISIHFNAFLI